MNLAEIEMWVGEEFFDLDSSVNTELLVSEQTNEAVSNFIVVINEIENNFAA